MNVRAIPMLCLFLLAAGCGREQTAATPVPAPAAPAAAPLAPDLNKAVGRWERTDGEYALQIKAVAKDGKAEAGYFNPKPIHVARAEVRPAAGVLNVFVELQDENYPGCTYTLKYDAARDALIGVYYQALMKEEYEVAFTRAP